MMNGVRLGCLLSAALSVSIGVQYVMNGGSLSVGKMILFLCAVVVSVTFGGLWEIANRVEETQREVGRLRNAFLAQLPPEAHTAVLFEKLFGGDK